jgi:hypothetical protein
MNEQDKLIIEIMQLGYLVQRYTKYCVFIDFSGHIDKLEINIRESKENWRTKVLDTEFYTEYEKLYKHEKDPFAFLKAKRNILARIIREEEIPYEDCDVEQHVVNEYSF